MDQALTVDQGYSSVTDYFDIHKVHYPDFIEEIGKLRYEVWSGIQTINRAYFVDEKWLDETDPFSHHWVVLNEDKVIAAARLTIHNDIRELLCYDRIPPEALPLIRTPVASLNRLVVHHLFRGHHLSKVLDRKRITFAEEMRVKSIVAEPVIPRIKLFFDYGFQYFDRIDVIPDLPEVRTGFMVMNY